MKFTSVLKFAGVAGALVLMSACASNKSGPDVVANGDTGSTSGSRTGNAVPGSQEDLEQNAGHRVFFSYNE